MKENILNVIDVQKILERIVNKFDNNKNNIEPTK